MKILYKQFIVHENFYKFLYFIKMTTKDIILDMIDHDEDLNVSLFDSDILQRYYTPLGWAINTDDENLFHQLIKAGADVNTINIVDATPLMIAIDKENDHMVKLLIENGANVNQIENGNTALINAVEVNSYDIVKRLIENGADPNLHGTHNSALFTAVLNNNPDIVELLIEAGANPDTQIDGETALFLARYKGYKDIEDYLTNIGNTYYVMRQQLNRKMELLRNVGKEINRLNINKESRNLIIDYINKIKNLYLKLKNNYIPLDKINENIQLIDNLINEYTYNITQVLLNKKGFRF